MPEYCRLNGVGSSPPDALAGDDAQYLTRVQGFIVKVLHDILRTPSAQIDLRIESALSEIGSFLGCDRTYVFRLRDHGLLDNTHEWCSEGVEPMREELQGLPVEMIDYWMDRFRRREAVNIDSVQALDVSRPERDTLMMQSIQSLVVVAMFRNDEFIGFVGFDRVRIEKKFLQGEVYLLQSAADVIMSVLLRRDAEELAQEARDALRREQVFLQSILRTAASAIIALDEEHEIVFANDEAKKIIRALNKPAPGESPAASTRNYLKLFPQQVLLTGQAMRDVHHVVPFPDGSRHVLSVNASPVLNDEVRSRARIVCSIMDVTREVSIQSALQTALTDAHRLAFFDALTGLPNRSLVTEQINRLGVQDDTAGCYLAIICLAIDNMRAINELHGVQCGDKFLGVIADRLQHVATDINHLGRISGNEFTFLIATAFDDETAATETAQHMADRILAEIRRPIELGAMVITATASAGLMVFKAGHDGDSVLSSSSMAARAAKSDGGDRTALFETELHSRMVAKARLNSDLAAALEQNQFCLHFEPQVRRTGDRFHIIAYEALIRWQHPVQGLLHPAQFIPYAEESGVITEIDNWVVTAASQQLAQWSETAMDARIKLSLNVSSRRLMQDDFVDHVETVLKGTGADASRLRFELTESSLLNDSAKARNVMMRLSALGISLALDDFGTGFSSLKYLHDLPVDMLKIDRSFIRNLWESERNAAIIKSIISLGKDLGLQVIAEGVEDRRQLDWLYENGCTLFQGYYFDRPKPASAILSDLARQ